MNSTKRRWIAAGLAAGALLIAGVGGIAAIAVPANATTSVSTPSHTGQHATDGETADDDAGQTPDQETADAPGHEDATNDGETADDAPTG